MQKKYFVSVCCPAPDAFPEVLPHKKPSYSRRTGIYLDKPVQRAAENGRTVGKKDDVRADVFYGGIARGPDCGGRACAVAVRGKDRGDVMDTILKILAAHLRTIFKKLTMKTEELFEIRLRAEKPLVLHTMSGEFFLTGEGKLTSSAGQAYIVRKNELRETMEYISNYSLYAFGEEVRQGYITLPGGHRVGICGRVVLEEGHIHSMKYIACLNIRFAHPVLGCADGLMPYIREGERVYNTLFIAPPGCGKTTMLRDVVRQLSDGGKTVGVVDERSEIAACSLGVPQFDVGLRTDVLDCCPKAEGMMLLIRSMAPEVLAVDEVGRQEDFDALTYALRCGCVLLATVHGEDFNELLCKPGLREICAEGLFERYLILGKKAGRVCVREVLDGEGRRLIC